MRELTLPLLNITSFFDPWGELARKVVDRNVGRRHTWDPYIKSVIRYRVGMLN